MIKWEPLEIYAALEEDTHKLFMVCIVKITETSVHAIDDERNEHVFDANGRGRNGVRLISEEIKTVPYPLALSDNGENLKDLPAYSIAVNKNKDIFIITNVSRLESGEVLIHGVDLDQDPFMWNANGRLFQDQESRNDIHKIFARRLA